VTYFLCQFLVFGFVLSSCNPRPRRLQSFFEILPQNQMFQGGLPPKIQSSFKCNAFAPGWNLFNSDISWWVTLIRAEHFQRFWICMRLQNVRSRMNLRPHFCLNIFKVFGFDRRLSNALWSHENTQATFRSLIGDV